MLILLLSYLSKPCNYISFTEMSDWRLTEALTTIYAAFGSIPKAGGMCGALSGKIRTLVPMQLSNSLQVRGGQLEANCMDICTTRLYATRFRDPCIRPLFT